MVPTVGLEPTRPFGPQILSLRSLPIPSRGHIKLRGLQLIRICLLPYARCLVLVATLTGRLLSLHILYFSDSSLVAMVGLEPTRCLHQRILSPPRLPIPPHRHISGFLEAPQNLSLKRISRACTPSSAASLDNSHFRLGRCHHLTCVFVSAPRRTGSCIRSRLAGQFSGTTTKPSGFLCVVLVIVQTTGSRS